jgi:hypothetical protein
MRNLFLILVSLLFLVKVPAQAQELRAIVTINAPQLTIIDRKVINEFEKVVTSYLNNTRFTDEFFEPEERIDCNFTFTISSETNEREFTAELLIQSSRPVFGSDYSSTLINYLDKPAKIQYEEFQPIEFNQNSFTSSLSSLLTFYAYLIIGVDADTYAPLAGEEYYRQAENVVTLLPAAVINNDNAWTNSGGQRTRFRLLLELLNPRARPYRQLLYDYHRKGLDVLESDPVAGRTVMAQSIENLRDVHSDIPNSILINIFTASKSQELIDVFTASPPTERKAVYQVLSTVDPAKLNVFRTLR